MSLTPVYIRHRDRMVEEAVTRDLSDTLIACRWMAGTTQRKVIDPDNRSAGYQILTVTENQVMPLVGKREDGTTLAQVKIVDYFPEAGGQEDREGVARKTELNTFALDHGLPQDSQFIELGSNMVEQPYVFAMAMYASSDAVAAAVMNDLKDRYLGRIVRDDSIDLFDYNAGAVDEDTVPITRLEVDFFRHQQSSDQATPWDVNIWYADLQVTDAVDPA